MDKRFVPVFLAMLFFVFVGFVILWDQYLSIGIWFQMSDIHHETLALASFFLAIGILIGSVLCAHK
jgi:hypothetical protein